MFFDMPYRDMWECDFCGKMYDEDDISSITSHLLYNHFWDIYDIYVETADADRDWEAIIEEYAYEEECPFCKQPFDNVDENFEHLVLNHFHEILETHPIELKEYIRKFVEDNIESLGRFRSS